MKSRTEATRPPESAVDRGTLLKRGGISAVGGALLLGAPATALAAGAGKAAPPWAGRRRKVIWATPAIGDWNFPLDVGFLEATSLVGWRYQKVGVPEASFSLENSVNNLERAIQAKPDVLITLVFDKALLKPLEKAQKKGILVIANNVGIDERKDLNIAYVGASFADSGVLNANLMGKALLKLGRKSGVIVFGNQTPGGLPLEQRYLWTTKGLADFNKKNGTTFTTQVLPDKSTGDIGVSISIYKAKFTQLGDKLVGLCGLGLQSMVAQLKTLEELGTKPGSIPIGGFDTSPDVNKGIKDGYISYAIDQQLYLQAVAPVILAWQQLARGFVPPLTYDTSGAYVTRQNLAAITRRDALVDKRAKELGLKK